MKYENYELSRVNTGCLNSAFRTSKEVLEPQRNKLPTSDSASKSKRCLFFSPSSRGKSFIKSITRSLSCQPERTD